MHGSNRSMGTKNCGGNWWDATEKPLILCKDNSDMTLDELVIKSIKSTIHKPCNIPVLGIFSNYSDNFALIYNNRKTFFEHTKVSSTK